MESGPNPDLARFFQVSAFSPTPVTYQASPAFSGISWGPHLHPHSPSGESRLLGPRTSFLVHRSGSLVREGLLPEVCSKQWKQVQGLRLQGLRGKSPFSWKKDSKTSKTLKSQG